MSRIVVAGAGHGGLSAAYNLARNGYDVTVFEKKQRADMGYDWADCMNPVTMNFIGMPMPKKDFFKPYVLNAFYDPSKTVKLDTGNREPVGSITYVERKPLLEYLMANAESAGVKLVFGVNVKSALVEGGKVCGITVEDADGLRDERADLVIDSAGIDSPVRQSLPSYLGIQNIIKPQETFYVYRAYYDRKTDESLDPGYGVYFFHAGHKGIDWIICEEDFIDILVGCFGSITEENIKESLDDFYASYGFIGDKILRGGSCEKIPLRKTLPLLVSDGYALIGDGAAMTEPLSGSGINLSLRAGKILADVIVESYAETFPKEFLWKYQYRYFKSMGEAQLNADILKTALSALDSDDIEALMKAKVLTAKEMFSLSDPYSVQDIIAKVKGLAGRRNVLPPFIKAAASMASIGTVRKLMPEKYDASKFITWKKAYEKL